MKSPQISIITATYNSSHLLKHAIQSVLNSDFQDWELLVVGDCCTDDTEEVVKSFLDPRIQYFNLEKNSGQQATPNNFGLGKAKGEFIAFLNQDDLFLPDHMRKCLEEIKESGAEFLVIPGIRIKGKFLNENKYHDDQIVTCSIQIPNLFSPKVFCVASTWFFKKSLMEKLGDWKIEKDLHVTPSQEWIFRAFLLNTKFYYPKRFGVLILLSGERHNSYLKKESPEHHFFSRHLNDPIFMKDIFEKAAINSQLNFQSHLYFLWKPFLRWFLYLPIEWMLIKLKIHPNAFRYRLAWKKKGGLIQKIRKFNGLN